MKRGTQQYEVDLYDKILLSLWTILMWKLIISPSLIARIPDSQTSVGKTNTERIRAKRWGSGPILVRISTPCVRH